jgi:hypothetical protein
MVGMHDTDRFGDINISATPPFTQDEETSGVIDVQSILGPGWYLLDDQAHYRTGIPLDIVEGGQLLAMYNPSAVGTATLTQNTPAQEDAFAVTKTPVNMSVSVSPNPASSTVKVSVTGAKGNVVVTLMDMNGRVMWSSGSTQQTLIPVATEKFAKGTYIVSVKSDTEKAETKLVIVK